jgi:hypothetical protein
MEDALNEIMSEIKEISLPSGSIRRGGGGGVGSILAKSAPARVFEQFRVRPHRPPIYRGSIN